MTPARIYSLLCSLAVTVGSLCAPSAEAAVVQVSVVGIVTTIDDHHALGFNNQNFLNLAVGDSVTGSWSYDTSTPYGLIPISGLNFGYFMPGGMSFSTGGQIAAYANFANDRAIFSAPGDGRFFPNSSYAASLQFMPNYFDAIPPSHLDMSGFLFGSIFGSYAQNPFSFISFSADITRVTSVVPIPSAVWLFLSGLLGVLGFRRFPVVGRAVRHAAS